MKDNNAHHVMKSYGEEMDFPARGEDPSLRYMLAASPRTGSTFLAFHLWRSGLMGAPMEYLNLKHCRGMLARLGEGDYVRYWHNLKRVRSSPNGVFGIKMFIGNYKHVAQNSPELLSDLWMDKSIHITRKDKIGQAISHYRAEHGGVWFSGMREKSEVEYDYAGIKKMYDVAVKSEKRWQTIFSMMGAKPFSVVYEDMITDIEGTLGKISGYFGIDYEARAIDFVEIPAMQRDDISSEWHKRFEVDLGHAIGHII